MEAFLDFEKPIAGLEKKLHDLRELNEQGDVDLSDEIKTLEKKISQLIDEIYSGLTPWQRVQLSRHPNRPYTRDYIENIFPSFQELHGDRGFGDDPAIMAGIASWPPNSKGDSDRSVLIIGHQKGRTTKQKVHRNFGMAKPEGYRKAMRLMKMADRLKMPILTFIDTPGAYPGLETEERGQAQAIAESIRLMFGLNVPVLSVVLGEGGSGGALAIGIANRILMTENSTYSVISPEGCASILWSDAKLAERASECLKMNPNELYKLGVIDGIVPEPKGGAHRNWQQMFKLMSKSLVENFDAFFQDKKPAAKPAKKVKGKSKTKAKPKVKPIASFRDDRIQKFRTMGMDALARAGGAKEA